MLALLLTMQCGIRVLLLIVMEAIRHIPLLE
nr:MAG TPA: hypothetical protein [Caudoviricetes sp.]DAX00406.1 MAG TPA: hypothetical protein [Bacteriophage sp.]